MEAIGDGDDDESDDCEMTTNGELPVDLVSIPDDSDNDALDASKLFGSGDPFLRAIFTERRRPQASSKEESAEVLYGWPACCYQCRDA